MWQTHVSTLSEDAWSDIIVCHKCPCYIATETRYVIEDMGVKHIMSSPHYHQSNGLAEKYVKLVIACYTKPGRQVKIHILPLCYTGPPLDNGLQSPMELLYARQAKSDLPVTCGQNTCRTSYKYQTKSWGCKAKNKKKVHTATNLLPIGKHVLYKTPPGKLWYPGIITTILQDGGSYIITIPAAVIYRHARFHLKDSLCTWV